MPLLYYWRGDNYRRDLDMGAGYHLNQDNPLLHEIDIGDSLWAFTRTKSGGYALAAELMVRAKTLNPPNFRYGRYRLWGDLRQSRYFRVEDQTNIEQVVRSLSVRANAPILGQSFQGRAAVRPITREDHQILVAVAKHLPLEARARLLPEERLEAALLLEDEEAVGELLQEESPGIAEQRRTYLFSKAPKRNKKLVHELQELYEGKCQICLWSPVIRYGDHICHGHHIHWLSRGGEDSKDNLVLICPNHHAAIHRCDAPLDYRDLTFNFGSHREAITINLHLPI
jgi:5-methylcytosine-specific restriction protein A